MTIVAPHIGHGRLLKPSRSHAYSHVVGDLWAHRESSVSGRLVSLPFRKRKFLHDVIVLGEATMAKGESLSSKQ